MTNDVLIKWIGSKRLQSPHIIKHFPKEIDTYYEVFLGGGFMLYALMTSGIPVKRYVCNDLNTELIGIWTAVKNDPEGLAADYQERWTRLGEEGKDYYYAVRREFNEDKDPKKFFFLLRTCRNGLVRYNSKGEFNTSFHQKRQGIKPEKMRQIIQTWSGLLKEHDVEFVNGDYRDLQSKVGDFIYLDPPYATPDDFLIYFGMIDYEALWDWMRRQPAKYVLSLNGFKGEVDCTIGVPDDVYTAHALVPNGLSKMDQMVNNRIPAWDSLYVK